MLKYYIVSIMKEHKVYSWHRKAGSIQTILMKCIF